MPWTVDNPDPMKKPIQKMTNAHPQGAITSQMRRDSDMLSSEGR